MIRLSNIEILRIVAMFLILQSHFACHGYFQITEGHLGNVDSVINEVILRAMVTGYVGNALFMIITGYFLLSGDKINKIKLLTIVVQVMTYSFLCYIAFIMYKHDQLSIKELVEALTPLTHNTYWFFTAYVLVYIFHPFLNRLLIHLGQRELGTLIFTMIITWGIIPSLFNLRFASSEFLQFVIFYFIGAYIRLYYVNGRFVFTNFSYEVDTTRLFKILLGCLFIWVCVAIITSLTPPYISIRVFRLYNMGSPLTILLSITIFLLFLNTRIKAIKIINTIAGCMGGVYLFHENPYVRSILYEDIFQLERYKESDYIYIVTLGFIVLTLITGVVIELVRKQIFSMSGFLLNKSCT